MREFSVNWIYIPLNEIEDVLDSNQCVKLITRKQPTNVRVYDEDVLESYHGHCD